MNILGGMSSIRDIIKALGGPGAVARELGDIGVTAVSNWSRNDAIPREHQLRIWRMCVAAGIDWTPPDADGAALVLPSADPPELDAARPRDAAA